MYCIPIYESTRYFDRLNQPVIRFLVRVQCVTLCYPSPDWEKTTKRVNSEAVCYFSMQFIGNFPHDLDLYTLILSYTLYGLEYGQQKLIIP